MNDKEIDECFDLLRFPCPRMNCWWRYMVVMVATVCGLALSGVATVAQTVPATRVDEFADTHAW